MSAFDRRSAFATPPPEELPWERVRLSVVIPVFNEVTTVESLLRRGAYFALMAEAKSQGVPVAGHVPMAVSLLEAAKAGQKSNEHLGGFITDLRPDAAELRAQPEAVHRYLGVSL